jgi:hypothetical protein
MLAALAAGGSHPVVAGLLGIGTAGVAGGVVAMAWSVHVHQIRLAGQLARRQLIVTGTAGEPAEARVPAGAVALNGTGHVNGGTGPEPGGSAAGGGRTAGAGPGAPVVIEGPDTVVAGDQARFRVAPHGSRKVESWAAGGGAVTQSPDPAHPDELLLVADEPGTLTVTVRVREGMTQYRGVKSVTAVPDLTPAGPPVSLRLFLQGWGLVAVAILVIGFAGSLAALGTLAPADFIALVTPLAALIAVAALARGPGDGGGRAAGGHGPGRPGS